MKKSELKELIRESYKEILTEARNTSPIHKFVYFSQNYPNNWINTIWKDNRILADHLESKFNSLNKRYGTHAAVLRFYLELDNENEQIFDNWIINNYNG